MRELKFRVWHKKGWIIPEQVKQREVGYSVETLCNGSCRVIRRFLGEFDGEVADCIIQQYIEVKDVNGVEIFEGDIVRCAENCDGRELILKCVYDPTNLWYGFNYKDDPTYDGWYFRELKEIEVIGNICENPEPECPNA